LIILSKSAPIFSFAKTTLPKISRYVDEWTISSHAICDVIVLAQYFRVQD